MEQSFSKELMEKSLSQFGSSITIDTIQQAQEFLQDFEITLESLVGTGSFGIVLKGYDHSSSRDVAVKLFISHEDQQIKDNILEYQKMKLIKSPNVIASYDFYYDDQHEAIYMITEYCKNGNLFSYLEKNKPLEQDQIIQIFNQILEGIKAIHSKNIIHSDLKPQNIVLSNDYIPKICDFGFSKKLFNKSHTQNKGFTIMYAAIEQTEDIIYKESDIYSAGSILCFLCGLNLEDNFKQTMKMKQGVFPDISNHKQRSLIEIAFLMMKTNYTERLTISQAQNMLNSLQSTNQSNNKVLKEQNLNEKSKNGYKIFQFNNGDKYEGEWSDNRINGQGKYYFVDGNIYEGQFKNNKRHGQGKFINKNTGDIFNGEWQLNKKNGYGVLIYGQYSQWYGDKYEGQYLNSQKNGKGVYYYKNGDKYEGEWLNDQKTGKAKIHFANGDTYEGEIKDDIFNGYGVYEYGKDSQFSGCKYEGNWINRKKSGRGTYKYSCGDKYEGEWLNNMKQGDGIYYWKDGSYLQGKWEKNLKEGLFILSLKDGKRQTVLFKNDNQVESSNDLQNI